MVELLTQRDSSDRLRQRAGSNRAHESIEWLGVAERLVDVAQQAATPAIQLTVVVPVYNEPHTVLKILEKLRQVPFSKQIVVVNDGSTDATRQVLESFDCGLDVEIVHHEHNRGKGAALQTGFRLARGEYIIVQDADLEYDPADIPSVIAPLIAGQAEVVYGSRYLQRTTQQDPSGVHRLGNWLLTSLSNWLSGYKLTDMETCYKAFRREILQKLTIEQNRFGFEPEITAKLAKHRTRIIEVPISYRSRNWSEGKKIGWRDLISTLYCIVRYNCCRSDKR